MQNVEVTNRNGVKTLGIDGRRERVIKRLEAQLKSGVKNMKMKGQPINGVFTETLEPKDIERIKKEIAILKGRV